MTSILFVALGAVAAGAAGPAQASAPGSTLVETTRLIKACNAGELRPCVELIRSPEVESDERDLFLQKALALDARGARKLAEEGCLAKRAASCHTLGILYQRGVGGARDEEEGAKVLQKACDAGRTSACPELAGWYLGGMEDPPRDKDKALVLLEKACAAGEPSSCFTLGSLHVDGEHVQRDRDRGVKYIQRATRLFEQACDAGGLPACLAVGGMFENGQAIPKNHARSVACYQKAARLLRQRCALGDLTACYRLGGMYRDGEGVPKDFKAGYKFLLKACVGGYRHPGGMESACSEAQAIEWAK
jgi:uncharacterized protein